MTLGAPVVTAYGGWPGRLEGRRRAFLLCAQELRFFSLDPGCCDHLAEIYKSAHDLDARPHRYRAFQNVREHHRAVFREHLGPVLDVLSALQGHNL